MNLRDFTSLSHTIRQTSSVEFGCTEKIFTFSAGKDSVFLNSSDDGGLFSEYGAPEEGELKKWEAVPLTKELIS